MKPFKRIFILTAMVATIVIFWLLPGINKANDVRYTRVYEDTDPKPVKKKKENKLPLKVEKTKREKEEESTTRSKRTYKTESIHSSDKLRKIKPSMFSRAIHFQEEIQIVDLDTVKLDLPMADSLSRIQ